MRNCSKNEKFDGAGLGESWASEGGQSCAAATEASPTSCRDYFQALPTAFKSFSMDTNQTVVILIILSEIVELCKSF
jgi:hypothetical protein